MDPEISILAPARMAILEQIVRSHLRNAYWRIHVLQEYVLVLENQALILAMIAEVILCVIAILTGMELCVMRLFLVQRTQITIPAKTMGSAHPLIMAHLSRVIARIPTDSVDPHVKPHLLMEARRRGALMP